MKHASAKSLERLAGLLIAIRKFSGLREKKTGIFYRQGKAYLHFHGSSEDKLFADIRLSTDTDFVRHDVSPPTSRDKFLELIERDLRTG